MIGARLPSAEDFAQQSDAASTSGYTFSGVTLSKAGLLVVRAMFGHSFNATRTIGSVTVGGSPAPITWQEVAWTSLFASSTSGLAQIELPAGASGNIVVNISGGNANNCVMQPVALYDLRSPNAHDANGGTAIPGTSVSMTLDIPASGIQVVAACSPTLSETLTPTGFTGVQTTFDSTQFHVGLDTLMAAETGRTLISAGSANVRRSMSAASWR